tara:strand:- start:73 stop:834 length:762 start_codon:yes stop_codon:yes gene_type:complete
LNTKILIFNSEGKAKYKELLEEMKTVTEKEIPYDNFWDEFESRWRHLLADKALTISFDKGGAINIDNTKKFDTKYDIAIYLYEMLGDLWESDDQSNLIGNEGLWSWISCFYLQTLSATNANRNRAKIYEPWYYYYTVSDLSKNKFAYEYRNIIYTAFTLFAKHKGTAGRSLLDSPIYNLGDGYDHVLSQHGFINFKPILEVFDRLCPVDKNKNQRRLASRLNQYRMVTDIYAMQVEQILDLLKDIPEYKPLLN